MDIVSVQKALQANECDLKNVSRMNLDHVTCDMVHEWTSSLPEANHAITKVEWFERDSSIIELGIHEGLRKVKIWTLRFNAITRKIFQVSLTRMINISGRPYPLENTIMVGNVSHNTKKYGLAMRSSWLAVVSTFISGWTLSLDIVQHMMNASRSSCVMTM